MHRMCRVSVLTLGFQMAVLPGLAAAFDTSNDSTSLLIGYGQSIPGWGQTTERVQTIDIVPRYAHVMFEDFGTSWWVGKHSTLIELPLHLITSSELSTMVGLNFLACYTFTADAKWQPYIFGGGGPVYSFADIPGMGSDWNGNYQFAIGMDHHLEDNRTVNVEVRYHHISNTGIETPNVPLNSLKILVGMSF
jgi:hypothetical protein